MILRLTFCKKRAILTLPEMTEKSSSGRKCPKRGAPSAASAPAWAGMKTTFRSGREARDTAAKSTNQGGTTGRCFPLVPQPINWGTSVFYPPYNEKEEEP